MSSDPWSRPYPATATAEDIYYCFRLLLGRNPSREEWPGHSSRRGENLRGVVASYANSLEAQRRELFKQDLAGLALATLPDFRIYVSENDVAVGRHVQANAYEPEVTSVFRALLEPGMGVVDLGANIGYFTMLSAHLVGASGYVLAVEPNPRNAKLLEASRRENGFAHVTVAPVAAAAQTGMLVLHASHSNGTTSAPPDDVGALLHAEIVPCARPDDLLPPDRPIHLIKADVEGAEYLALSGCRRTIERFRPAIISEFSPGLMTGISGVDPVGYLRWLADFGYALSVIEPDGTQTPAATPADVMTMYAARGTDHIDLLARPSD